MTDANILTSLWITFAAQASAIDNEQCVIHRLDRSGYDTSRANLSRKHDDSHMIAVR